MMDSQLFTTISDLCAHAVPSGSESIIEPVLRSYVEATANEVWVDPLGTLIARHHGSGPHILVTAHVDEPGLMAIDITDDGFLRVVPIGSLNASQFVDRQIRWTNGVVGLVGAVESADHGDLSYDDLYVDIGATSKDEAAGEVTIGTGGVLLAGTSELGNGRLTGRALHNRVGCAIAISAFQQAAASGHNVTVAFTAQHVVGARGVKTAAYALRPDYALVIDGATAGDLPDGPRSSVRLGRGPAIRLLDRGIIVPVAMKSLLETAADSAGIDVQYDVCESDRSDAGTIEASAAGVLVGGVTYPVRGAGQILTTVDITDAAQAVKLVVSAVDRAAQLKTEHK
ncbi:M42 family metallopeptidase [Alicyclobacillus sp. ALC3]|uniref:M42 family metallopeptidase n=1 Tax=Alicyclobacillus sp. ALC3 TaxID=2796143 RepID=UPI002378F7D8|nr:peptidase M42 [Alicyclobacillus sp. ALC3]WDL97199.1 peptidase M42 [Alicyclobacillus sp. ALC3]